MNISPRLDSNSVISVDGDQNSTNHSKIHSNYFDIEKIHSNIHFLRPRASGYPESNVIAIEMENGLVLIDSFISPQVSAELFEFIEENLKKPIQTVINSHCHFDHLLGYVNISPTTSILAGPIQFQKIREEGIPILNDWVQNMSDSYESIVQQLIMSEKENEIIRLTQDIELYHLLQQPNFHFQLPNLIIPNDFQIVDNKMAIFVKNFGSAFTEEDLMVSIPRFGIAFLGPILCPNCLNGTSFRKFFQTAVNPQNILRIINSMIDSDYSMFIGSKGHVWKIEDLYEFRDLLANELKNFDQAIKTGLHSSIKSNT